MCEKVVENREKVGAGTGTGLHVYIYMPYMLCMYTSKQEHKLHILTIYFNILYNNT